MRILRKHLPGNSTRVFTRSRFQNEEHFFWTENGENNEDIVSVEQAKKDDLHHTEQCRKPFFRSLTGFLSTSTLPWPNGDIETVTEGKTEKECFFAKDCCPWQDFFLCKSFPGNAIIKYPFLCTEPLKSRRRDQNNEDDGWIEEQGSARWRLERKKPFFHCKKGASMLVCLLVDPLEEDNSLKLLLRQGIECSNQKLECSTQKSVSSK